MIKPKLALIPAAQGSKLYSVLPSSGVGDFNFTRGSAATRVNKDGLIETVGSGVSRLNYPLIDGVVSGCPSHILEPTKTNFIQYSEDFTTSWVNNGASITANQIISPSGDLSADLLTGVSGGFGLARFSMWSTANKVASCFAKKGSSELFKIGNASIGGFSEFNLADGTVTQSTSGFEGSIENYGNGWYRCTAIDTLARNGTFSLGVTAASESIYVWGAQMESGSYSTSYTPTAVSIVTRSSETATGSGDASTFNDSEGVLMAEISLGSIPTTLKTITLSDGTTSNQIDIRFYPADWNIFIKDAFYLVSYDLLDITASNKLALYYNNGNTKVYINGILLDSKTYNGSFVGLNKLNLSWSNAIAPFYGNTKQLQYFDSALNDSDLETLTSWTSFRDMANGQLYTIE